MNRRSNPSGVIYRSAILALLAFALVASCSDSGTETNGGNGGQTGNPPVILNILPDSAYVGEEIRIIGLWFTAQTGLGTVTMDGLAMSPTVWTDTLIVSRVPEGASAGSVRVSVNNLHSNVRSIVIRQGTLPDPPFLSSLSRDTVNAGDTVRVHGLRFGSNQGISELLCGGFSSAIVAWSETMIDFIVPYYQGSGNVVVKARGQLSNALPITVLSASPYLSSLSPPSGRPGDIIILTGARFGASAGSVTFNSRAAAISTWTDIQISAIVPAEATTGPVVVHTSSASSNALHFTVLPPQTSAPFITSLSPDSGTVGTTVAVVGGNFGSAQGTSTVTFNGVVAAVAFWSDGVITTSVPVGATSGSVIVTAGGQSSNGLFFRVLTSTPGPIPTITEIRPNPANVGERVRIHGTNFGPETPVVTINGVSVALDEWRIDEIRFYVPANVVTGNLVVTVGGRASAPAWFTIIGTVPGGITLTPPSATVAVGGTSTVTIAGGTPPYAIQTPPNTSIASASLSGSTITLNGVAQGATILVVQDNANPTPATATLNITVYAPGSGISFSQQIQPIFNTNCTSCHGGSGGLTLTAGQSYNNLVNVQAQAGCTTEKRVLPGNAGASVLYKRISGTSCGDRMPRGLPPLSPADIQKIMDWINQGALNN